MTPLKNLLQIFQKGKFPFKFIYSDKYWMHNMKNHIFPVEKYRMIYERLLMMGARKEDFLSPHTASVEDVLLAHTSKYVKKLRMGKLSHAEVMSLELPYSPELFEFALMYVGGTIVAAEQALKEGMTVVVVTHLLRQARRLADHLLFLWLGELVESGPAIQMFSAPKDERTQAYLAGDIG